MANGEPPEKSKRRAVTSEEALQSMGARLNPFGLSQEAQDALARMAVGGVRLPKFEIPTTPTVLGSGLPDIEHATPKRASEDKAATPKGGVAGGAKSTPPARRIRASKTHNQPGKRIVKEYPITEDVLDNIGTLRASSAFWAAVGSLAAGFALSAWMSISLSEGVAATTLASWLAYRNVSGVVAALSYVAAAVYFSKGKSVIQYVKDTTTHDAMD